MDWQFTGYAASVLVIASFIPQLWKGYRTKSLNDISYYMPGLLIVSSLLWVAYGLVLGSYVIWVLNILLALLNLLLIMMKYNYSRK